MAQYKVGTISVTNGSAVITGSGTDWNNVLYNIKANDSVFIAGDTVDYRVLTVDSATQITLTGAVQRSTGSGLIYAVSKDFTPNVNLPLVGTGDIRTDQLFSRAMNNLDSAIGGGAFSPTFDNLTVTGSASIVSADINGGNIDGTVIGATTAAAGTFTTVLLNSGSAATPSLAFSADTDTGFYRDGANRIGASAGGNLIATFDSTGLTVADGYKILGRGSVGQIPFAFHNDTDTGLGRTGVNAAAFYCGGTAIMDIDDAVVSINDVPFQADFGSLAAPGLSFFGDGNTGFYRPANGEIGVSLNGSEGMRITASGLGIGTTSPDSTLHVVGIGLVGVDASATRKIYTSTGNLQVNSSTGNAGILIDTPSTAGGYITFGDGAIAGRIVYEHASDHMAFQTGASERARIASSGNFGIGTTSPDDKLHVAGSIRLESASNNGYVFWEEGTGGTGIAALYNGTGNRLDFVGGTGNNPTAFATSIMSMERDSGNVGIGTTSPAATLHVLTASSSTGATPSASADDLVVERNGFSGISILSGTTSSGSIFFGDAGSTTIGRIVYDHSVNDMAFFTNNAERVTIKSAGNVGIGTTSPSVRLDVVGGDGTIQKVSTTSNTGRIQVEAVTAPSIRFDATGGTDYTVELLASYSDESLRLLGGSGYKVLTAAGFSTPEITRLYSNNTLAVTIDAGQNVGIGTTSPDAALHVVGNGLIGGDASATRKTYTSTGNLQVNSSTGSAGILIDTPSTAGGYITFGDGAIAGRIVYEHASNHMAFQTGASERVRIASSGNVGIGTTSPSAKLHVNGTVRLQNLPTSSSGLSSGDLWNDGGTLKIA